MVSYKWDRELFKKLIKDSNTTQDELAKKIGISKESLQFYINGKTTPSFTSLLKIADYFGLPIDVLIGRCSFETYDSVISNFESSFNKLRTRAYEDYLYTKQANASKDLIFENINVASPWPYNLLDILIQGKWETVLSKDQEAGLEYALSSLHKNRDREYVLAYFRDEKTLTQISIEAELSVERVRQIMRHGVGLLRHPFRFNYILYGLKGNKDRDEVISYSQQKDKLEADIERLQDILDGLNEKYVGFIKEYESKISNDSYFLDNLDLSVRSYNCLRRADIRTLDDIHKAIVSGQFIKIRNFGKKSAEEVLAAIQNKFNVDYFDEYRASLERASR